MPADYVADTMNLLLTLTGRLSVTHADYHQARQWAKQGIPWACIDRGMRLKAKRAEGRFWLRTMALSWCEADVQETYLQWRRAVGPWGRQPQAQDGP